MDNLQPTVVDATLNEKKLQLVPQSAHSFHLIFKNNNTVVVEWKHSITTVHALLILSNCSYLFDFSQFFIENMCFITRVFKISALLIFSTQLLYNALFCHRNAETFHYNYFEFFYPSNSNDRFIDCP